jgi:hypothetical protein
MESQSGRLLPNALDECALLLRVAGAVGGVHPAQARLEGVVFRGERGVGAQAVAKPQVLAPVAASVLHHVQKVGAGLSLSKDVVARHPGPGTYP